MSIRRSQTILLTLSATVLGFGGFLGLAGLSSASPAAQEKKAAPVSGSYQVDAVHSAVIFRIKHIETSLSFGRFNAISGDLVVDEKNPEKSSVKITIEMDSVDTANQKRNDHLKSPDFFDAVQFPTATFVSKSVKKAGDKKFSVTGDLELHGVTKPLTLELENTGFSDTKMGVRIGYYTVFTVKRSDFGVGAMSGALGDEVQVTVSLEATQTDSKR
jgi:polyisoprenoid-binding protein YceI